MILRIKGLIQITIISIAMAVGAQNFVPLHHGIAYAGDEIASHPSDARNDVGESDARNDVENGSGDVTTGFSLRPITLSPTVYALGGYPRATAVMDLDNDGNPDILVTNPDDHNISILLNKGDGTFEQGDSYPIDGFPFSITPADIDSDYDDDLVVLDSYGSVKIFFNSGDGKFSPGGSYPVPEYSFSMNIADTDQDEDPDIITFSARKTGILLNDGAGNFSTGLTYPSSVNSHINITADLNSDERDDLIIGDKGGISVILNNGDNTFPKGMEYATGDMPISVVAGDLDSDGYQDLIVANYRSHTISILRNNRDGTFQEALNYPSGKGPNSITLADIDLDEGLDIIVTNGMSGDLSIFINNTVRPVTVITDLLPKGRIGQSYETKLEAKGGIPPYKWDVISGSLPPSVHLDPLTGEVFSLSEHDAGHASEEDSKPESNPEGGGGEPLMLAAPPCLCLKAPTGLYRFTVEVTDSSSMSATADLYIEVLPQPGTISGKITYSGEKKGTIRIGLWSPSQGNLLWLLGTPIYVTRIKAPGEYKLENIYPESYTISAYLDANGDGRKQMDEPYGVFKSKKPGEKPEAIVIDNGTDLTGIDIELVD